MAVSATKMNSNWLASSINCCFPTRLPDRPHYEREFERDMDKQVEAQGYSTARREPAMPMSSMFLAVAVICFALTFTRVQSDLDRHFSTPTDSASLSANL